MNVLVLGGSGYVGSVLVPLLLSRGRIVTVYDALLFGCHLPNHPNLRVVQGDICDTASIPIAGQEAVIHLACLSNDASVEANMERSKAVNMDSCAPLVKAAKNAGVQRFIYASTSAVYGPSDTPRKEDDPLYPMFPYAKWKAECEPIVLQESLPDFVCTVVRPAALSGYSPRLRLDLTVNILTNHAYHKGRMTVFNGAQYRSNLHVEHMAYAYLRLIDADPGVINGETFNIGSDNATVSQIAAQVAAVIPVPIDTQPARGPHDEASYQLDSTKWQRAFGAGGHPIRASVLDLQRAFANHIITNPDDPIYFNAPLREGWRREGTSLISPRGIPEADLSQVRTVPVASRVPGGSAPPPPGVSAEEWADRWRHIGGVTPAMLKKP